MKNPSLLFGVTVVELYLPQRRQTWLLMSYGFLVRHALSGPWTRHFRRRLTLLRAHTPTTQRPVAAPPTNSKNKILGHCNANATDIANEIGSSLSLRAHRRNNQSAAKTPMV